METENKSNVTEFNQVRDENKELKKTISMLERHIIDNKAEVPLTYCEKPFYGKQIANSEFAVMCPLCDGQCEVKPIFSRKISYGSFVFFCDCKMPGL